MEGARVVGGGFYSIWRESVYNGDRMCCTGLFRKKKPGGTGGGGHGERKKFDFSWLPSRCGQIRKWVINGISCRRDADGRPAGNPKWGHGKKLNREGEELPSTLIPMSNVRFRENRGWGENP